MKDDIFEYTPIYSNNKQIGVLIYENGMTQENAIKILTKKNKIPKDMYRILTPEEEAILLEKLMTKDNDAKN